MPDVVRFQSAAPNRHGTFPGVFALANGLREEGRLSDEELAWLADRNAHMNAAYADPSTVSPGCYDRTLDPRARAWFRIDAVDLLRVTREYLELLHRHGVAWHELRTRTPGGVVYADDVQVIAVPHTHDDWPFR
ncbi:hypothetical protein [Clavibacter michiganensis]|uniref:hypothetical protein n=1 Tax=Clavibacter michiganensis TaxID=28447 RepID=UPI0005BCC55D|nr:hypothetical protein [Clavibacter michiganensis]